MRPGFEHPIIYLITAGEATDSTLATSHDNILSLIRLAIEEKVSLIQLREKSLSPRPLFELARAAVALTEKSETRLLVNGWAGIALAARADGVHLSASSLTPAAVVRKNLPAGFIIGVSTHSFDAADAVKHDADFVVFGPVFETPGKGEATGLKKLTQVCDKLRAFPVIGLGGIDESNCESVMDAGASGIAAIRCLNDPDSLRSIVRKLRK